MIILKERKRERHENKYQVVIKKRHIGEKTKMVDVILTQTSHLESELSLVSEQRQLKCRNQSKYQMSSPPTIHLQYLFAIEQHVRFPERRSEVL